MGKEKLIEEYNKKINMIQFANNVNERKQEEQKESTSHLNRCIDLKKVMKLKKINFYKNL